MHIIPMYKCESVRVLVTVSSLFGIIKIKHSLYYLFHIPSEITPVKQVQNL